MLQLVITCRNHLYSGESKLKNQTMIFKANDARRIMKRNAQRNMLITISCKKEIMENQSI